MDISLLCLSETLSLKSLVIRKGNPNFNCLVIDTEKRLLSFGSKYTTDLKDISELFGQYTVMKDYQGIRVYQKTLAYESPVWVKTLSCSNAFTQDLAV